MLTVDNLKLETISFNLGHGYGVSGPGYVSQRGYIEYKDVTLTEIEAFVEEMIHKLSLYELLPNNGLVEVVLSKRLVAGSKIIVDETSDSRHYLYDKKTRAFEAIDSSLRIDAPIYKFNVYTDIKGDGERAKNVMSIYKKFQ